MGGTGRTFVGLSVAALLALGSLTCPANAAYTQPLFPDSPPPSFDRSAREAIRKAARTGAVRAERERRGRLMPVASYDPEARTWEVNFYADGEIRVQVVIADRTGRPLETWTGVQAKWAMARPIEGKFGHALNAPYIWIPLCVLFVLPFVDPRRPFRLLHLDLLVLLAFGVSTALFNKGEIVIAMPLAYPVLGYLLVRMLMIGFRPRGQPGPLIPWMPLRVMAIGLIFLVSFRVTLNLVDSSVTDVGFAGVIGADRILRGDPLYDGRFPESNERGDTYGPVMYAAYVPFYLLFGWSGKWDALPTAHAAAIGFDLLVIAGLLLLGRAIRAGPEGKRLGLGLAFAWAAYPYTTYVMQSNTNDALVAALLVFALLAVASAPGRGVLIALAGAAKLAPLILVPLFATAAEGARPRRVALFAGWLAATLVILVASFAGPLDLAQIYDRTLAFQFDRESPFSLWGAEPSLAWLQRIVQGAAVALALLVALRPKTKDTIQVAALAAAVLIVFELALTHWFYLYIVWFLPLVLLAVFASQREAPAASRPV